MVFEPSDVAGNPITLSLYDAPSVPVYSVPLWPGYRGLKFKTSSRPLMVTALGRLKASGNTRPHRVILQRCAPAPLDTLNSATGAYADTNVRSEEVASAVVDNTAGAVGQYVYATLEQPVVLEPLTEYYLASYEQASDQVMSGATTTPFNANAKAHFADGGADPTILGAWGINETQLPAHWDPIVGQAPAIVNLKIK